MSTAHAGRWSRYLRECGEVASAGSTLRISGRLTRATGMVMEATGLRLAVGACCSVVLPNANPVEAEVVGFSEDKLYLMPLQDVQGLTPGAKVVQTEVPGRPPRSGGPPSMSPPGC